MVVVVARVVDVTERAEVTVVLACVAGCPAADEHAAADKLTNAAAATARRTLRDNGAYQSSPRNSRIVAMNCS